MKNLQAFSVNLESTLLFPVCGQDSRVTFWFLPIIFTSIMLEKLKWFSKVKACLKEENQT
jgi:hypothetical protein